MSEEWPKKVVVAVHGVGDQVRFETIQKVARMFCRCAGVSGAIPLGRLYGALQHSPGVAKGFFRFDTPPDPDIPELGLAEVYWADIPREPAKDGYTLEETKEWARTIVERLQCRQLERLERPAFTLWEKTLRIPATLVNTPDLELSRAEFKTVKQVLTEMIESIGILEHLVAWLEKTTRFRFPLKSLLVDFVDDVQVVAEYKQFKEEILNEFLLVMGGIFEASHTSEIYIVAHSEGTVVSFLALLEALKSSPGDPKYDWVQNVKGFMTFGSPIGKHITLWPELWKKFESTQVQWRDLNKIPWFNYYDYGDPIGFELDIGRRWMADKAHKPPFEFPIANDIGFSRYTFPGKAHNDYWNDDVVFQHFIGNVEGLKGFLHKPAVIEKPQAELFRGRWYVKPVCAVLPYLLVITLCTAGVWIFYKSTAGAVKLDACQSDFVWNVAVLGLALALSTAASRIPRLARAKKFWALAAGLLAASVMLVASAPTEKLLKTLDTPTPLSVSASSATARVTASLPTTLSVDQQKNIVAVTFRCTTSSSASGSAAEDCRTAEVARQICSGVKDGVGTIVGMVFGKMMDHLGFPAKTPPVPDLQPMGWKFPHPLVMFNLLFVFISAFCGFFWPRKGLPLTLFLSGTVGLGWVLFIKFHNQMAAMPLWPALSAGGIFLYLWWLASLIFDLTFVWHRYIRSNVALSHMDEINTGHRKDGGN
jgi:hypothetical protein